MAAKVRRSAAATGLTFRAWRQRAPIVRAIDHLARGKTIAQAAGMAGFSSTAAFSYAFRQVTGGRPRGLWGGVGELTGKRRKCIPMTP